MFYCFVVFVLHKMLVIWFRLVVVAAVVISSYNTGQLTSLLLSLITAEK